MLRLATCKDLIYLRGKHRFLDEAMQEVYRDVAKSRNTENFLHVPAGGDLAWGLKQLGTLYCADRLSALKPQTILEAGAGLNTFFDAQFGDIHDYWMIDKSGFYDAHPFAECMAARKYTTYVDGLLGDFSTQLPSDHFDFVFSISVLEHVPFDRLRRVFKDIFRVLRPGGSSVHTIDVNPHSPAANTKELVQMIQEAGFEFESPPSELNWDVGKIHDPVLLEPLSIVYQYYYKKSFRNPQPDPYLTCYHFGSIILSISKPAAQATVKPVHGAAPSNYLLSCCAAIDEMLNDSPSQAVKPDSFETFKNLSIVKQFIAIQTLLRKDPSVFFKDEQVRNFLYRTFPVNPLIPKRIGATVCDQLFPLPDHLTNNAIFCLNGSPKEASVFASQAILIDDTEPLAFFLHGIALLNADEETESGCSSLKKAMSIVEQKLYRTLDLSPEMISNYEMIRDVSRKRLELYSARTEKPHESKHVQALAPQPSRYTSPYGNREQILARSRQSIPVFKDRHSGQRCVIIGNGPSLNKMDLSFLEHEITFGMNRIYLLFDKWKFRPTYYVTVNPLVIEQSAREILSLPMPKFVSHKGIQFFTGPNDLVFLEENKEWVFSKDPLSGLHEGWTVTFVAMQLAYYMGFKEVILIGVDHHFVTQGDPNKEVVSEGADPNHFHPDYFGKGVRWHLPDLERSEGSYMLAKLAFEADGRRVLDATVDGKLTIFPKVDYQKYFATPFTPHDPFSALQPNAKDVLKQANNLIGMGHPQEAFSFLENESKKLLWDATIPFALGLMAECSKDRQKTVAYFETAVRQEPNNVNYILKLATSYFTIFGKSEDALNLLRHAIKIDERNIGAYELIAEICRSNGQIDDAMYFKEIAIRLANKSPNSK